ncbi:MAG TPA: CPBP family intramembrane glutamic endopeptidase [Candidatus Dormibacteraeota bacterium]|jgi:membrane protease YdiL (CAAX protease family)|nr:CPBP family intramembrane glutamic endopeptidase [Candidatus Dormibacteraeota bacterium]
MSFPHTLAYAEPPTQIVSEQNPSKRRWFELALITFVAFSGPLTRAIAYFRSGSTSPGHFDNFRWLENIFHELGVLLLLAYILRCSGRSFRNIGFRWSFKDAGIGVLLLVASYIVYGMGSALVILGYRFSHGGFPAYIDARQIFGHVPWMALPFTLLNPFFEELLVRAYLMTEIRELTGSVWLASIASVVLQTSCHIYYGWVGMFSVAFLFIAFTIFFAIWRRSMSLVVAHGVVDLIGFFRLH